MLSGSCRQASTHRLLFILLLLILEASAFAQVSVDGSTLLGARRVDRTTTEFTYSLQARNHAATAVSGVTAQIRSNSFATQVVDGTVTFGVIPGNGSATGLDTFAI